MIAKCQDDIIALMESKHSLFKNFQFALAGLKIAIRRGRNFRIQLGFGIFAIILGFILGLSGFEWVDLILIIAVVLVLELINTSIEAIVDMISPQIQEKAKIAKDVSAAAVLVTSIAAILMGVIFFLPKILSFLSQ